MGSEINMNGMRPEISRPGENETLETVARVSLVEDFMSTRPGGDKNRSSDNLFDSQVGKPQDRNDSTVNVSAGTMLAMNNKDAAMVSHTATMYDSVENRIAQEQYSLKSTSAKADSPLIDSKTLDWSKSDLSKPADPRKVEARSFNNRTDSDSFTTKLRDAGTAKDTAAEIVSSKVVVPLVSSVIIAAGGPAAGQEIKPNSSPLVQVVHDTAKNISDFVPAVHLQSHNFTPSPNLVPHPLADYKPDSFVPPPPAPLPITDFTPATIVPPVTAPLPDLAPSTFIPPATAPLPSVDLPVVRPDVSIIPHQTDLTTPGPVFHPPQHPVDRMPTAGVPALPPQTILVRPDQVTNRQIVAVPNPRVILEPNRNVPHTEAVTLAQIYTRVPQIISNIQIHHFREPGKNESKPPVIHAERNDRNDRIPGKRLDSTQNPKSDGQRNDQQSKFTQAKLQQTDTRSDTQNRDQRISTQKGQQPDSRVDGQKADSALKTFTTKSQQQFDNKTDVLKGDLNSKFGTTRPQRLDVRVDSLRTDFASKFGTSRSQLDGRFDSQRNEFISKFVTSKLAQTDGRFDVQKSDLSVKFTTAKIQDQNNLGHRPGFVPTAKDISVRTQYSGEKSPFAQSTVKANNTDPVRTFLNGMSNSINSRNIDSAIRNVGSSNGLVRADRPETAKATDNPIARNLVGTPTKISENDHSSKTRSTASENFTSKSTINPGNKSSADWTDRIQNRGFAQHVTSLMQETLRQVATKAKYTEFVQASSKPTEIVTAKWRFINKIESKLNKENKFDSLEEDSEFSDLAEKENERSSTPFSSQALVLALMMSIGGLTRGSLSREGRGESNTSEESSAISPTFTRRRTHIVESTDTLQSIAEKYYGDARVAWLIADINSITEHELEKSRVVELNTRQLLELPELSEAREFLLSLPRNFDANQLTTIVTDTMVNLEVIQSLLGTVLGKDQPSDEIPPAAYVNGLPNLVIMH